MPPFIPKKRLASPPTSPKPTPPKKAKLVDALDADAKETPSLKKAETFSLGSDDSDSSLSDVDNDEFQDVTVDLKNTSSKAEDFADDDNSDEDEDIEWEDAGGHEPPSEPEKQPLADGDIKVVFQDDDNVIDYGSAARAIKGKKGPSRREKRARIDTHQMHVQFLLWHNSIRNRWICDTVVQQTLVDQLPSQIKREVEKWRRASGMVEQEQPKLKNSPRGKKVRRGKPAHERDQRNWGRPSAKLEPGKADMSNGDPLISLLKVLSAYWKKRFAITAPGLRKRGYSTKLQLKQDIRSYQNDKYDIERHGEVIRNLKEFREIAKICEGSRDVGAQLFTALLRGLGIESRLIASLQPAGFGWTKAEQMAPRKPSMTVSKLDSQSADDKVATSQSKPKTQSRTASAPSNARKVQSSRRAKGNKDTPIDVDSDVQDNEDQETDDDGSVIDVTPSLPKARPAKYDRDLPVPIYWTEAISPITSKVMPVSPLVLEKPVATTQEDLCAFEPRGAKAEKVRLVIAYVVGYSSDGTAKDVTVRYLRKHIWPGKTKTFRFPIEKVPVYDKRGRVKRYEDFDWFKYIMSGYVRTDAMRTAVDDIEDSTDLVPQLPEKKEVDTSVDTLQSLKASADFVLERHLRREEAVRPGCEPDRYFMVSKKGESDMKQEPVYRRADVERCLTAESWHKEGRRPKAGEVPLKMVPVRAVTLTRKREAEEHERITGEKQMQGLYSWDQTEYIIPPPIKDGMIPKNSYGNIDCFVPSMVPKGAVHIPLRGTVRICKKLEIDYAEAVVGFEFGNKRAVPVINGVVVAKEHEQDVKAKWKEWNDEQRKKEETKMEKLVLDMWRKFVVGLRIRERVGELYGGEVEEDTDIEMETGTKEHPLGLDDDDHDEMEPAGATTVNDADDELGGGFLLPHEDEDDEREELVMEDEVPISIPKASTSRKGKEREATQYPTPVSMSSAAKSTHSRRSNKKSLFVATAAAKSEQEPSDSSDGDEDTAEPQTISRYDGANDTAHSPDNSSDLSSALSGSSDSSEASSTSSDEEESEESEAEVYNPPTATRSRRLPQRTSNVSDVAPSSARSTRSTRSKPSPVSAKSKPTVDMEMGTSQQKTPTRTTKRKGKGKIVTSPYFDESA